MLWARGWAEMNAGNISIDVTEHIDTKAYPASSVIKDVRPHPGCAGRSYLVTTAGSCFRDLPQKTDENIVVITVPAMCDGYMILRRRATQGGLPTSELAVHLGVHGQLHESNRPERAVLHTHPTHLIALTCVSGYTSAQALSQLLCSMHPEIPLVLPDGIGWVGYYHPGSEALATSTVRTIKEHTVIVWEKHGCVAVGDTLEQAFDRIDIINKAAQLFFLSRSTGKEVESLRERDINELKGLSGGDNA
jgi:rhamnulose-1-phosphate aldolase